MRPVYHIMAMVVCTYLCISMEASVSYAWIQLLSVEMAISIHSMDLSVSWRDTRDSILHKRTKTDTQLTLNTTRVHAWVTLNCPNRIIGCHDKGGIVLTRGWVGGNRGGPWLIAFGGGTHIIIIPTLKRNGPWSYLAPFSPPCSVSLLPFQTGSCLAETRTEDVILEMLTWHNYYVMLSTRDKCML